MILHDLATKNLPPHLEEDPRQILAWAFGAFGERILLASSLGPQSLVILDLAARMRRDLRVVFLETGLHFDLTGAFLEEVERHFGIQIERLEPEQSVEEQAREHGPELWELHPDRCCQLRKVEPLRRALGGVDAWITGLRRSHSTDRALISGLEWDHQYNLFKVNPLLHWSRSQVDRYVQQNGLPVHPLRERGYASIGCAPCTLPTQGDDERSGRWAGSGKRECGLHLGTLEAQRNAKRSVSENGGKEVST